MSLEFGVEKVIKILLSALSLNLKAKGGFT
jgi:hypothetical protein